MWNACVALSLYLGPVRRPVAVRRPLACVRAPSSVFLLLFLAADETRPSFKNDCKGLQAAVNRSSNDGGWGGGGLSLLMQHGEC